jgi:hypothetical protein
MPDYSKISRPGLIPVKIENQGTLLTTQVNKINFIGTGVVASVGDFNDVIIEINGGGFSTSLTNATFSNPNLTFTRSDNTSFSLNLSTLIPTSASYALSSSFAATASSADTFIVRNQLTASGLNYPTADNGEFSFIQTDGLGNLSLQYVNTLYETIYNGEATTIIKGTPVYVSGSVGANSKVYRADAGNPLKMPVIYIAADNIASADTGRGIALGLITGVDTTGYPAGTEVYVAVGGGWTSVRPTGSAIVQILGIVTKEGSGGQGVVLNPGPANLPNLPSGSFWVGNSGSFPVAVPTASLSVATASFATSASFATTSLTASFVNPLTQSVSIRGLGTTDATTTLRVENANASASLVVRDDGNVGIGTSVLSNDVRLTIKGEFVTSNKIILNLQDGLGNSRFSVKSDGGLTSTGFDSSIFSIFSTGDKQPILFSHSGYGTNTPDNTTISIGYRGRQSGGLNSYDYFNYKIFQGSSPNVISGFEFYTHQNQNSSIDSQLALSIKGADLLAYGNVGIGTSTPSYKLDVSGSGRFTNGLTVTGSLTSPSITGSLFGTASQAISASYAPSSPAFPYTGSAEISGSLVLSGSAIIMGGVINSTSTGTTSGTDALIIRNSNQDTLLNIKDDGDISINTTRYSSNGVLTNNAGSITEVVGFNGIVSFPTNPPGQQNLQFTNGILVNVF